MSDQSADMLEFAAILGEAIAHAHLSGKGREAMHANDPVDDGREVRNSVESTKEASSDDEFTTKP